jgi:hypothetical protein
MGFAQPLCFLHLQTTTVTEMCHFRFPQLQFSYHTKFNDPTLSSSTVTVISEVLWLLVSYYLSHETEK